MSDQLGDLIKQLSEGTNSILVLEDTVDSVQFEQNAICITKKMLGELSDHGQFDFVLIKGLLEHLSHELAEHVIAQVRDLHAREMLLITLGDSEWKTTDFIGLGLRQIAEIEQQGETSHAWYFSLETYKRTPDWLNNRYWANPEKFDKYRW